MRDKYSPQESSIDIDPATLTSRIRCMPGMAGAELLPGWKAEKIGKSAGYGTLGIFRLSGEADTSTGSQTWSTVLKALAPREDQARRTYTTPENELAAYRSGLFAQPMDHPGFRAVTCYGIDEREDGSRWLWLEDIRDAPVPPWSDDVYISAARHVGQFNGEWALRPAPDVPWLLRDRLNRESFSAPVEDWDEVGQIHNDPLMGSCFGAAVIERASEMGRQIAQLVAALERQPVTVCHSDCHPKNLFPVLQQGVHTATVAVDWAAVGVGPVGMDAGPLIGSGLIWTEMTIEQAQRIERKVCESYLLGLEDEGWRGDPDAARLAYLTFMAADYGGRMALLSLRMAKDQELRSNLSRLAGKPIEVLLSDWRKRLEFMFPLMDEAVGLAKKV